MEINLSSHFLKRAKRLSAKDKKELSVRTDLFRENPNDPGLKTHALSGKLKSFLSFSINRKKRVKFMWVDKKIALFIDVGPHDEVYR